MLGITVKEEKVQVPQFLVKQWLRTHTSLYIILYTTT